jgi:hypothetical protein
MAFVALTPGETDADSPLTETLFTKIKDNFDSLEASQVTNGDSHNHDGGDGAVIPQGGLKTASGSVDLNAVGPISFTLPGGAYGFYPQLRCSHSIRPVNIQASPPYKIGGKEWNHFLYALVNSTGDIIAAYEAEDPPYAYNGPPQHGKDSIERIASVPHPFADYWQKDPADDGLEIVLFDLREKDTKKWRGDMAKQGKVILEDLAGNVNSAGILQPHQSLGLPNIPGFTDKVKIRR